MDDEDELLQNKSTENVNPGIHGLRPLGIILNHLELPANGVFEATSNYEDRTRTSSSQNEEEGSSLEDSKKEKKEACGKDTEETIKKIKEFIAMGRCEDSKKDADNNDKGFRFKPGPLSRKKDLIIKEDTKARNLVSSEMSKFGRELERTLTGQDSCDNPEASEEDLVSDDDVIKVSNSKKEREVDNDVNIKNSDLVTPSRVSKRIQSKSVKFSAKKMLRGDDVNVLKRMIPGYEDEIPPKKERLIDRPVKREHKKVQVTKILGLAPEAIEQSPQANEQSPQINTDDEKENVTEDKPIDNPINTPEDKTTLLESQPPQPSENSPETNLPCPSEKNDSSPLPTPTPTSLAEKLGKIGSVSSGGKITLELKGTSQKKVVRIAIPPQQPSVPMPKTSLGPDIIIKRVKPVKKTIVVPENTKLTFKNAIEKEIEDHRPPPPPPPSVNIPKPSKFPFSIVEKVPVPKVKGSHILLPRNILKRGRPPKNLNVEVKPINMDTGEPDKLISPNQSPQISEQELIQGSKEGQETPVKENKMEKPSLTQQIAEALENSASVLEESVTVPKEELTQRRGIRGRKPKNLNFSPKSKSDSLPRKVGRPRKIEIQDKSPVSSDAEEPEEKELENLFDKYFTTEEKYIEHHDSLDSDSSDDYDNEIYSHFINLRLFKSNESRDVRREDSTMYDIMSSISAELPSWNIHVSSNGEMFYLAQIDTSDNIPIMKKVIEIDLQYNAKVLVDGAYLPEYEGNVSSYEDIKQLVYDIDQL